jgi:hypothetical protein
MRRIGLEQIEKLEHELEQIHAHQEGHLGE